MNKATLFIFTLAFSQLVLAAESWESNVTVDKMTGERKAYVISPHVSAVERMAFPYQNVRSWIEVGCTKNDEWVVFGFTAAPNLVDTTTEEGYNRVSVRIKWDQILSSEELLQEWGSVGLHFQNSDSTINKLLSSKSALLELNWYGAGNVYFQYSLTDAKKVITSMRATCAKRT